MDEDLTYGRYTFWKVSETISLCPFDRKAFIKQQKKECKL